MSEKKPEKITGTPSTPGATAGIEQPTEKAETGEAASALRDNIQRKGQNSYYYAHSKTVGEMKNYGGAPQKIATQSSSEDGAVASAPSTPTRVKKSVAKYAWSDEGKKVCVYLNLEGVGELESESVQIISDNTSLKVSVIGLNGDDYEFVLTKLYEEVSSVTMRKKKDKIVLGLIKKTQVSWLKLQKA